MMNSPHKRASNAEHISIWWRHHEINVSGWMGEERLSSFDFVNTYIHTFDICWYTQVYKLTMFSPWKNVNMGLFSAFCELPKWNFLVSDLFGWIFPSLYIDIVSVRTIDLFYIFKPNQFHSSNDNILGIKALKLWQIKPLFMILMLIKYLHNKRIKLQKYPSLIKLICF